MEKKKTKPIKYTATYVKQEVEDLFIRLCADDSIIFKGQLIEKKPYSLQRFSEWEKKFAKNKKISETIEKINDIFHTRALVGGLKNKYNPTITKFHLINNFGYRDKSEVEHSTPEDRSFNVNIKTVDDQHRVDTNEEADQSVGVSK